MVQVRNITGLSREFIIHPGETLSEVIEDRGMTQSELAVRTGMTEKHISTVINGSKGISAVFAKRLEFALGIEASFWMNLQANYERELCEFEEINSITAEECEVLDNLKEINGRWIEYGWIDDEEDPVTKVMDMRSLLRVSNLLDLPKVPSVASCHIQKKHADVDPYILCAWQRTCELMSEGKLVSKEINVDLLRTKLTDIKKAMLLKEDRIRKRLMSIFAECGITFIVVPYFDGAPVEGYISKCENGSVTFCITQRQYYSDSFWLALFRGIVHILNGDIKGRLTDFESDADACDRRTTRLAQDLLIDADDYKILVESGLYTDDQKVTEFAQMHKIEDFIVYGRLVKDGLLSWENRPEYDWS